MKGSDIMSQMKEFTVPDAYVYNQRSPIRWIASHVWRHKHFYFITMLCWFVGFSAYSLIQVMAGQAVGEALEPTGENTLLYMAVAVAGLALTDGLASLTGGYSMETLGKRFTRDAREE